MGKISEKVMDICPGFTQGMSWKNCSYLLHCGQQSCDWMAASAGGSNEPIAEIDASHVYSDENKHQAWVK